MGDPTLRLKGGSARIDAAVLNHDKGGPTPLGFASECLAQGGRDLGFGGAVGAGVGGGEVQT
jgi:hypothetical protein